MKASVFTLVLVACVGAFCASARGADEENVLVTTADSPLFAGPGPYYKLVTVLPTGFVVDVPQSAKGNPRWWMPLTGFPLQDSQFKKLTTIEPGAQKRPRLWVSVRNVKPKAEAGDVLAELAVAPTELTELTASRAVRGFVDWVATIPAGKTMTRADLVFVLTTPFAPGHLEAFRKVRTVSRPNNAVSLPPARRDQLDFLSRLRIGLHVLNKLSKQLEGDMVKHKGIGRYLNLVASYVAENSVCYDRRFRVILWQNDELTCAFSTPGGFIIITTGLLRQCRDEAELAGMLAHEMAHVYFEHGLKTDQYAEQATGIIGFADLERELDRTVEETFGLPPEWHLKDYEDVTNVANNLFEKTLLKRYLVADEKTADRFAAIWTRNSGYDPTALGRLLARLHKGTYGKGSLTNHGPVEDRLAVLRATIRELKLTIVPPRSFEGEFKAEVTAYFAPETPGDGPGAEKGD